MKRRFRQKQDKAPKDDPEKDKGITEDSRVANVDIADVIEEIDKSIENKKHTSISHLTDGNSRQNEQDINQ